MTMAGHLVVCLVSTFAHEGLEGAGTTLERCEAAHRHHRSVLCAVKKAIVWNCGRTRKASE